MFGLYYMGVHWVLSQYSCFFFYRIWRKLILESHLRRWEKYLERDGRRCQVRFDCPVKIIPWTSNSGYYVFFLPWQSCFFFPSKFCGRILQWRRRNHMKQKLVQTKNVTRMRSVGTGIRNLWTSTQAMNLEVIDVIVNAMWKRSCWIAALYNLIAYAMHTLDIYLVFTRNVQFVLCSNHLCS